MITSEYDEAPRSAQKHECAGFCEVWDRDAPGQVPARIDVASLPLAVAFDERLDRPAFAAGDVDDAHVRKIDANQPRKRVRFVTLKRLGRRAKHPEAARRA